MRLKITRFFCIAGLIFCINVPLFAQNSAEKSEDYKKWSLEQLLFTIDSGLLDKENRLEYIEFYLQKAKRENSISDIVTGYEKKITNLDEYNLKTIYADSLIKLAHQLEDKTILGTAYYSKSYTEIVAKNYESALDYGLKAEEYLKDTEDLYTLNEIKNVIGISYFHLERYNKAYKIYRESTSYHFENKEKSYNNKKKYIIHLFGLSKSAYRLEKYDTLQILIKDGYKGIKELKAHHQPLETAYFSLIEGMYHHTLQEYNKSDSLLNAALPHIKEKNDFANEHLIYLYLGKNLWQSGKKQQALGYFEKIDLLYHNENFINTELSEAYTYIIDYYKEQKNTEKQLHYTNIALQISNELQAKNKNLTDYLHTNLDTKKLEESKAQLEKEISGNKNWSKIIYAVIMLLIIIIIGLFIGYKKSKKQLHNKYEQLVNEDNTKSDNIANKVEEPEIFGTTQILLEKLAKFEDNKGFLQKITLEDLADEFLTNRTTLSQVLNEHKGGIKDYLKKLRVDYAINHIKNDPRVQQINLDALAEEFGFGSGKSFSAAFKEITDMNLNDFIRLSKQNTGR